MAELGMRLARSAAALALQDWTAEHPPTPDADTVPQASPAPDAPPAPRRFTADPGLLYARLTRSVRQAIALEARITADHAAGAPRPPRPPLDPRRPMIREAIAAATKDFPDRAACRRETDERLEQELLADPERLLPIHEIFLSLCDEFELSPDLATLPDELLGVCPTRPPRPAAWATDRNDPALPDWATPLLGRVLPQPDG